jgi:hypothetical protein
MKIDHHFSLPPPLDAPSLAAFSYFFSNLISAISPLSFTWTSSEKYMFISANLQYRCQANCCKLARTNNCSR